MPTATRFANVNIADLSGGLNVRDALTELAPNESPDLWNVTCDERGGIRKRLGYSVWNQTSTASPITYGTESKVCHLLFWYRQASGTLSSDAGDGVLTVRHTFTAGATLQIVDFAGVCYAISSSDGLYQTTDGITWIPVAAASGTVPHGNLLTVWQNKLWVASGTQLFFSAPGDATKWDSADDAGSNYIREGNDYPIVSLFGAAGTDLQAQPALLVGKRSGASGSFHRVTDAATGDYVTLDQAVGPGGANSITSLYGWLYVISPVGVFKTDGQSPLEPIAAKLEPLFRPDSIDYSLASGFCAGHELERGRVYFSLARQGAGHNDLCLDYNPSFQAFTARSDAVSCYVSYTGGGGDVLLGTAPAVDPGEVWRMNSGGSDDGSEIQSWFTTRVFEPGGGYQARLQHAKVVGRGSSFTLTALPNFQKSGSAKPLSITGGDSQWDVSGWDDASVAWGEDIVEGYADFHTRLKGRAFQLRFDETSSATALSPALLADGLAQTVGAWALYGLHLAFTPLGPS